MEPTTRMLIIPRSLSKSMAFRHPFEIQWVTGHPPLEGNKILCLQSLFKFHPDFDNLIGTSSGPVPKPNSCFLREPPGMG